MDLFTRRGANNAYSREPLGHMTRAKGNNICRRNGAPEESPPKHSEPNQFWVQNRSVELDPGGALPSTDR